MEFSRQEYQSGLPFPYASGKNDQLDKIVPLNCRCFHFNSGIIKINLFKPDHKHTWGKYRMLLLLLSRFSRVQLCATPKTAAHQAPLSLGFSRQEYWSGLPFPSPKYSIVVPVWKKCFRSLDFYISLLWGRNSMFLCLSSLVCNMEVQIWLFYNLINDKFLEIMGLFTKNICVRYSDFVVEFCYYYFSVCLHFTSSYVMLHTDARKNGLFSKQIIVLYIFTFICIWYVALQCSRLPFSEIHYPQKSLYSFFPAYFQGCFSIGYIFPKIFVMFLEH